MTAPTPKLSAHVTHFPKAAQREAKATPQQEPQPSLSPLQILFALENEALAAPDRLALKHQAVNNPRRLLDVGHIFWITRNGNTIKIGAMSSQSEVNKSSPFIQDMCHALKRHAKNGQLNKAQALSIAEFEANPEAAHDPSKFEYAFPQGFFAPFAPHSDLGGLLFTRATPFDDTQATIMTRLAQSYGAIWSALSAKPRATLSQRKKLWITGGSLFVLLCGFIPVPVVTLAPAEIVADAPFIIAAPMDGVVEDILIPPNSYVDAGAPLIQMVDTEFKSELDVAAREESVSVSSPLPARK